MSMNSFLVIVQQVFCQPIFSAVETYMARRYPNKKFLHEERALAIGKSLEFKINIFRLMWRAGYVIVCTFLAILLPFFNSILGILGALSFWPLTVYFPIEMYIARRKIERSSFKWMALQSLSMVCLLISLAAAVGSIEGVIEALKHFTPFQTKS